MGFPGSSVGKESACQVGDVGLIPGSGRSPGEGNGNPLQYSCLENPIDRGAWRATVQGVTSRQGQRAGGSVRVKAGRNILFYHYSNIYRLQGFREPGET